MRLASWVFFPYRIGGYFLSFLPDITSSIGSNGNYAHNVEIPAVAQRCLSIGENVFKGNLHS